MVRSCAEEQQRYCTCALVGWWHLPLGPAISPCFCHACWELKGTLADKRDRWEDRTAHPQDRCTWWRQWQWSRVFLDLPVLAIECHSTATRVAWVLQVWPHRNNNNTARQEDVGLFHAPSTHVKTKTITVSNGWVRTVWPTANWSL
jgi:hypothetical protein